MIVTSEGYSLETIATFPMIRRLLGQLRLREAECLLLQVQGYTLVEIGTHYGVSHKRISQVLACARRKLQLYAGLRLRLEHDYAGNWVL